jgi:hypothetical protein
MEAMLGKTETNIRTLEARYKSLVRKLDLDAMVYKGDAEQRLNDHLKRIDQTRKTTACQTCPRLGECPYLKWDRNLDDLKVTGCSDHPNQEKYLGHSVTVQIYTDVGDNYGQESEGPNYATIRNLTGANHSPTDALYYALGGLYTISRMNMSVDTSPLPDLANISIADWYMYMLYASWVSDPVSLQIIHDPTTIHHEIPQTAADYDILNYPSIGSSKLATTFTPGAYNVMGLPTAIINKTGVTKWTVTTDYDLASTPPTGGGVAHWKYYVSNFPYVEITYTIPTNAKRPRPQTLMDVILSSR